MERKFSNKVKYRRLIKIFYSDNIDYKFIGSLEIYEV